MLSKEESSIIFLSLWYDSTWDWTQVSQAIGEHPNHYTNVRMDIYTTNLLQSVYMLTYTSKNLICTTTYMWSSCMCQCVCIYIYIYIYIYIHTHTHMRARKLLYLFTYLDVLCKYLDATQCQFFKQSLTGLN